MKLRMKNLSEEKARSTLGKNTKGEILIRILKLINQEVKKELSLKIQAIKTILKKRNRNKQTL